MVLPQCQGMTLLSQSITIIVIIIIIKIIIVLPSLCRLAIIPASPARKMESC